MKTVAIVDDEKDIVELASFYIEREGFKTKKFNSGDTFVNSLLREHFDCIILDLMLPVVDGISILKFIRSNEKTKDIPVIILTAKGSEGDVVLGLENGANDYVVKPFSPRVLAAKVKVFTREKEEKSLLEKGVLKIDFLKYQVFCKDIKLVLTPIEFKILRALVEHEDKVFTRDEILAIVWDYTASPSGRAIDVHIRHLREKLGECGKYIKTVRGVRYKFSQEELD
ncbi:MAG: DNA-binding response regulator [Caldiserica bacterium CG02_land_8_20_14_3_00_36_38]|nr:response regulator transcription factor [Caldisericota bacterium]PIV54639.1 MAG: DNA-binding response regulator [Caldiserica bacterium CG02_land_8_20_14_3_00_36_38]PIX28512.1 MAG: DNA-binding response regulator [Caldiserica bacterium CG_4_8_14_3_um_filter_35_18]